MKLYEQAVDAMALNVMKYFGLHTPDSYLNGLTIDVENDDLIYFIDLVESGDLMIPENAGDSVDRLLSDYRGKTQKPMYVTVVEDYIEESWEDSLDSGFAEIVEAAIRQGGIDNGDALFGGEFEARKNFVFAVCGRICRYIRGISIGS